MPHAVALVWGGRSDLQSPHAQAAGQTAPGALLGAASTGKVDVMCFGTFVGMLEQLRGALASHGLAAGVRLGDSDAEAGWLITALSVVGHSATAVASLKPSAAVLL